MRGLFSGVVRFFHLAMLFFTLNMRIFDEQLTQIRQYLSHWLKLRLLYEIKQKPIPFVYRSGKCVHITYKNAVILMRTYVVNIVFDLFHNPFERYCCNVTSYRQRFMLKIPFWLCFYRHLSCNIQHKHTGTYTSTVV